jgi:hypothetical protein
MCLGWIVFRAGRVGMSLRGHQQRRSRQRIVHTDRLRSQNPACRLHNRGHTEQPIIDEAEAGELSMFAHTSGKQALLGKSINSPCTRTG